MCVRGGGWRGDGVVSHEPDSNLCPGNYVVSPKHKLGYDMCTSFMSTVIYSVTCAQVCHISTQTSSAAPIKCHVTSLDDTVSIV